MRYIKTTKSICPECLKVIPAEIVEEAGKILMRKQCSTHGYFEDIYYGDAALYHRFMGHFQEGKGIPTPRTKGNGKCPYGCGLCENHRSSSVLANIDVTTACNYRCPICFADTGDSEKLFHPTLEEIARMMDTLREQDPPASVLQLSGGEPTVRKDFFEIVEMARQKGFVHIQVATNGKKIADDPEFAAKLRQAKVNTIYLQFDGTTPEPYIIARGFNALPEKIKALENMRKQGRVPNVVLVPTLVKGVNDHQIGDIIRFAAENIDIVQGVNFQPVSFTGRISRDELFNQRITIADFLSSVEKQLDGQIRVEDFFPIPIFTSLLEFLRRTNQATNLPLLNTHPACGAWTYVFKDGDRLVPINRVINVEAVFELLDDLKSTSKTEITAKVTQKLPRLIRREAIKHTGKILTVLKDIILKGSYEAAVAFHDRSVLFIGSMHFMDPYNFDCERLERCCIHYATIDGRTIPFCSYNTIYRDKVEKAYRIKRMQERFALSRKS